MKQTVKPVSGTELVMRNLHLAMIQIETGYEDMGYDLIRKTMEIIDKESIKPTSTKWLDRKVWFNELDGRARCAECDQIMFDVREHSCVESNL